MNPETIESFKIIGALILGFICLLVVIAIFTGIHAIIDNFGHIIIALILAGIGVRIIYGGLSLLFSVGGGAGAFGLIFLVPIGCVFFYVAYLFIKKGDV